MVKCPTFKWLRQKGELNLNNGLVTTARPSSFKDLPEIRIISEGKPEENKNTNDPPKKLGDRKESENKSSASDHNSGHSSNTSHSDPPHDGRLSSASGSHNGRKSSGSNPPNDGRLSSASGPHNGRKSSGSNPPNDGRLSSASGPHNGRKSSGSNPPNDGRLSSASGSRNGRKSSGSGPNDGRRSSGSDLLNGSRFSSDSDFQFDSPKSSTGRITIAMIVGVHPTSVVDQDKKSQEKKRKRKKGIIAPHAPFDTLRKSVDLQYEKYDKDKESEEQIKGAIMANDFLKNLMDDDRLTAVVEAMSPQEFPTGSLIIREGDKGSHLYVSAHGQFEVSQKGRVVHTFGPGEAFGELAILYKAKRFASIRCTTEAKIWSLGRRVFHKIMVRSGRQEQEDNVRFLTSVPLLQGMTTAKLEKISEFLKREFFLAGSVVVKQDDRGDKFYIIRGGKVVVTKRDEDGVEHRVGLLKRGDYFGEQALLHEDRRLATVTAQPPGVECLTLERGPFRDLLEDELINIGPIVPEPALKIKSEYEFVQLKDLKTVGTLGIGGFGRVELVQYKPNPSLTFALKCLKKFEMVQQHQQEHVFNEKQIMMTCNSPFICRLYRTFKDNKYIYFLMEPVLGGDVWTILQKRRYFPENVAMFMVACVVEAFQYLHNLGIVYRDLKPENLMLDKQGYIKVIDFGFAKIISPNSKTWTFAGTPEYVAPEIVLNKGHDRAVDCWALGVLTHELLMGKPPFRAPKGDHMKTYRLILRGIDSVTFHPRIPHSAELLIKKLCRPIPAARLGYLKNGMQDVKAHEWFQGFDWEALEERKMKAPLIRPIANDLDRSNFEDYQSVKEKMPPDETSGWDAKF